MARDPSVHEGVAGTGIPARHRALCRYQRDISNAANVHNGGRDAGGGELCPVKGRHKRRTLTARCDIAAPKIGDDGDSRQFREPIGVAHLHGIGRLTVGMMAECLSVLANCDDVGRARPAR